MVEINAMHDLEHRLAKFDSPKIKFGFGVSDIF